MAQSSSSEVPPGGEFWVGMPVIDAEGCLVGTVKQIRAVATDADPCGDPAVPTAKCGTAECSVAEFAQDTGPYVTDRLLLKVTGAGLMDNDRYVRAEQIATADDDSVHLSVPAGDLAVERWRWI